MSVDNLDGAREVAAVRDPRWSDAGPGFGAAANPAEPALP
jgi:hypothetical protein